MATASVAVRRNVWLRSKYLLFTLIALMMAYVLRHNESFLINWKDPVWQHYQPFGWWLLPHGLELSGLLAAVRRPGAAVAGVAPLAPGRGESQTGSSRVGDDRLTYPQQVARCPVRFSLFARDDSR